ncbi:SRPBCC family protein [Deinococcus cellulosilyticus]|uniref:Coenzyme Q-binding protein COQ10 START domain-containing protein n=1 Tax=Deinococcus cellulosilyticus (strain DSM 18568 / NBRC 106333 / KACC 11606 / 5516J-15) TaxID=1223518 RepID=A0A511N7R9_DEIC1|nr:SRPBCC family protein [Deinococcus cellulosilyticus]GEM48461.1 hypothetical protein DC3_40960 [Deinococcus cellulosilyticus NBRC 106333 = KACC 11606]
MTESTNSYHFVTHWRVKSTCQEISDILADAESLPRWWPSVYLEVKVLNPGNASGVGRVVDLYTKGWLPYTLRWSFTVTEVRAPYGFSLEAKGDFVGRGIWTFRQDGDCVNITYDWSIVAEKPLLKYLSFLMKPIFRWNHEWAMRKGFESLELELQRRHARTPEEATSIPAPPMPTFVR